ncbi:exodeoxyribonuclease VII large subunit [Desulfobotulus sp. H1]|uniref:Exodeoxyribonuclease 7 large subunit n=1 Tax=Desulfobotulus pelophilus TaxID=2823377 RepID=A0ABT3NCE4_9BACT|nr:exodeoxyribonuclease VII large subunit [Desulfobotulus pelophilus]MCW7755118.1 exodeoxyribonuclease VII large subunit [Desulfobotulus pelophilus]
MGKETRKIHTVSELTSDIRSRLESAYPFVWITGEVSNLSKPSSGHLYFVLKDQEAQIAAIMFRGQNRQLRFQVENGLKAIGFGRLSVYSPRGSYQLILEYLEPSGAGSLQLAFEQLKIRLEAEGLFDAACKRKLPFLPLRISLITSPDGAALHDMLKVLRNRFPALSIEIAPVRVQGQEAAGDICRAFALINEKRASDIIILARGGGSLEDLAAFNSEAVARSIFNSEIPVITGVGHETDFTIADFVADYRASTPTAAAEAAVPHKKELQSRLSAMEKQLTNAFRKQLERLREKNRNRTEKLLHPSRHLALCRMRVDDTEQKLIRRFQRLLTWKARQASWTQKAISPTLLIRRLQKDHETLSTLHKGLHLLLERELHQHRMITKNLTLRLENLSPFSILDRGYAVARVLPGQTVLKHTRNLCIGDRVEILLASGTVHCRIEEIDHG